MSALHEAVACAIEDCHVPATGAPRYAEYYAVAAVRVCLAEVTRAIEPLLTCPVPDCTASAPFCEGEGCACLQRVRAEALAVLAALAEEQGA